MKTQLQLTIFIVYFGLVLVHPHDRNRYQLWKKTLQTGVLESQNIFNNMRDELQKAQNTNIYRKKSFAEKWMKKREINNPVSLGLASATNSRSSQLVTVNDENKIRENAFDAMNEELQMVRSRNSDRERNLYKKSNIKITAAKRQTYEDIPSAYPFSKSALKDEQEWVQKYGTHMNDSGKWPLAKYFEHNIDDLKVFCIKAHKQLNQTTLEDVDAHVSYWPITFEDRTIERIWADMIQYTENKPIGDFEIMSYMYMIKGNRPDCVFYIKEYQQHADKLTEMVFAEHVCGIEGFEDVKFDKVKKKEKKKEQKKEDKNLDYL